MKKMDDRLYVMLTSPENSITVDGHKLYRIQATKKINNDVPAGTVGGYIEDFRNLLCTENSPCWVGGNAKVFENAVISGEASVTGNAVVSGNAQVRGYACVMEEAEICGDVLVDNCAEVSGCVIVTDSIKLTGNAYICGRPRRDKFVLSGTAHITGGRLLL